MKIGILTYHRAENYGALLQAYALRNFLLQQGHDVSFLDYWPKYHKNFFKIFPIQNLFYGSIVSRLLCLYNGIIWGFPRWKRKQVLQTFMWEQLGLSKDAKYSTNNECCSEYDVVVYGSDQIWRKQNLPGHKGFDYWYYGSNNVKAKKISYAGSMGSINTTPEEDTLLKKLFANFYAISVRESSLKDYLTKLDISSTVVLDPVFLLSPNDWRKMYSNSHINKSIYHRYILFYNLLNNQQSRDFAERLSVYTNLPIIEITKKYSIKRCSKGYYHRASVQEFLSLIDHAEYVVSNSFHGVAFSIIFKKQFIATGMGERANRVLSLLKAFGIDERYMEKWNGTICPINYDSLKSKMEKLCLESKGFLINAVNNEKNK